MGYEIIIDDESYYFLKRTVNTYFNFVSMRNLS